MFYYLGSLLTLPNANRPIPLNISRIPSQKDRFSVIYRGNTYYVSGDDTITVLAILNDLLNLHRDASEIPTTKTVVAVPQ